MTSLQKQQRKNQNLNRLINKEGASNKSLAPIFYKPLDKIEIICYNMIGIFFYPDVDRN